MNNPVHPQAISWIIHEIELSLISLRHAESTTSPASAYEMLGEAGKKLVRAVDHWRCACSSAGRNPRRRRWGRAMTPPNATGALGMGMREHTSTPYSYRFYAVDTDLAKLEKFGIKPVRALTNEGRITILANPNGKTVRVALVERQVAVKRGAPYDTSCPERDANAAFIVLACNAHEALVKVAEPLAKMLDWIERDHAGWDYDEFALFSGGGDHRITIGDLRRARAAIALVTPLPTDDDEPSDVSGPDDCGDS